MNPDSPQPTREEIESRLTALLLGELPAEEASLLRWAITQDPQLAKLHDRLKLTLGLVREVAASPVESNPAQTSPLKLSDERREKLLAHFKTIAPKEFAPPQRRALPSLVAIAAAVALIAVLAAMLLPTLSASKSKSQRVMALMREREQAMKDRLEADKNGPVTASPNSTPAPAKPAEEVNGTFGRVEAFFQKSDPSAPPAPPVIAPPAPTIIVLPTAQEPPTIAPAQRLELAGSSSIAPNVGEASFAGNDAARNQKYYTVRVDNAAPQQAPEVMDNLFQGTSDSRGFAASSSTLQMRATDNVPPLQRSAQTIARSAFGNGGSGGSSGGSGGAGGVGGRGPATQQAFGNGLLSDQAGLGTDYNLGYRNRSGGEFSQAKSFSDGSLAENGPANAGEEVRRQWSLSAGLGGFYDRPYAANQGGDIGAPKNIGEIYSTRLPGTSAAAGGDAEYSGNLSKSVGGALTLNGANTFNGGTTTSGGKLALGVSDTQERIVSVEKQWVKPSNELPAAKDESGKLAYTDSKNLNRNRRIDQFGVATTANPAAPAPAANPLGAFPGNAAADLVVSTDQLLTGDLRNSAPVRTQQPMGILSSYRSDDEQSYTKLSAELAQLKALNQNQLRQVLPTVSADPALATLVARLHQTEQSLARLKTDSSANSSEILRQQSEVDGLNQQIDSRVNGLMEGLSNAVKSKKDALDAKAEAGQKAAQEDQPLPKPPVNAPIPQPEVQTSENNFSTFSLNVSDVSFKLAAASLERGQLPDAAAIRTEEFINAFDYRDPEAAAGVPVAFAYENAHYPFAHNRDLLRFSIKTAAQGRQAGRPLNLVLLLDNSGSMERADRVAIIHEALRVLAAQLQPQDTISIITFARTARLWADGVSGDKAGEALAQVGGITPEGGTNLEEAMKLAYATAARHYLANGANRVVLLTDGAANLGNVDPEALKQKVEAQRKQGIALDCFGIGWEGFNDDLLEVLSRNGDGRYGFINTPVEAATGFAAQLAGALQVAASDVKVQVEFNPKRVTSWRQIGYAKHQLTKEQFRDNAVDAAEIAAQEAGNALYTIETNPQGEGPVATVRVRYKIPGTTDYREQAWDVPYTGSSVALEQSTPAMRLAATASAFGEWLAQSPFAAEVTPDQLLNYLNGVPEIYGADTRPKKLEWMIRQAKSLAGK
jgi:Mg-chelatase subunit ChlD/type II secretory pathway pseudopilin PulG